MADSNKVNVSQFSFLIMLRACIISTPKFEKQWMEIQQEREVHQNVIKL